MLHLGINTCFAAKRWPEPVAWSRLVEGTFRLRTIQFSLDLLDPMAGQAAQAEYGEQLRAAVFSAGLRLHSTFTGLAAYSQNLLLHPLLGHRLEAIQWYDRVIQLSAALGAEATGGHFGSLSMSDFEDRARREYLYDFLVDALGFLSLRAKQAGLKYLLWEPMPVLREAPATIRQALDLHNRANKHAAVPISFCLDLGHQCAVGVSGEDRDPYAWLRQLGGLCPCIHLQQTDGRGDHHWPFTEHFNREGIIRPDKVREALEKGGARDAALVFEIIHSFEADEAQVIKDIRESVEYWRPYF